MPFMSSLENLAIKAIAKFIGMPAMLVVLKTPEPETIPIQFNPSEYKITEKSSYTQKQRVKKDAPVTSFAGNSAPKLDVKLYFDAYEATSMSSLAMGAVNAIMGGEEKDIVKTIDKISALTQIDGDSHQPAPAVFVWGALKFVGVITSVITTYTMFDKAGKPLRAIVNLSMQGIPEQDGERRSPFMSPDRTKARILTEDNNIWNISEKEYGDTGEWRRIAESNDIMDPMNIPVGTVLKVPSITD